MQFDIITPNTRLYRNSFQWNCTLKSRVNQSSWHLQAPLWMETLYRRQIWNRTMVEGLLLHRIWINIFWQLLSNQPFVTIFFSTYRQWSPYYTDNTDRPWYAYIGSCRNSNMQPESWHVFWKSISQTQNIWNTMNFI